MHLPLYSAIHLFFFAFMLTNFPDMDLVSRAKNGDCEAFNLLVRKYQPKVRRLIGRFVADSAEVEDLSQEAFIKAYRAIAQFQGKSAFYTWLYKIAVNTAKNHLLMRRKKPLRPDVVVEIQSAEREHSADFVTDNQSPESLWVSHEIAKAVQKALSNLSSELRMAIELREFEGLSYDEIAQKMKIPAGTVRSRIFRARESIAAELKNLLDVGGKKRW